MYEDYGDYPETSLWWEVYEDTEDDIDWDFLFCGAKDEDFESSEEDLSSM